MADEGSPVKRGMSDHNGSQVALVLLNSIIFGFTVVLVHLWAFPEFTEGLYQNSFRNVTLARQIMVTPSDWVNVLWPIIFGWLLLCKLYTFLLLCRKNPVGPSYKSPPIVGAWFLFTYSLGLICVIAWTILADRDHVIAATVLIFVAAFFCWWATGVLYKSVHSFGPWMARHTKADLWLYRVFWHNGMAALTTWLSIHAFYFLAIVLRMTIKDFGQHSAVYVALGCISGFMILWFIFENSFLDRYGRYTVTPYMVIIVQMVSVYLHQYKQNNSEATDYFIVVLLGAAVFCLVLRLGLVIVRALRCPLYRDNKVGEDPVISFAE